MKEINKLYKINDIFYSIQGEGYHSGMAAIFIRFSGCNLNCSFCDTNFDNYELLTAQQILSKCVNLIPNKLKKNSILLVLTGGEPALHIDDYLLNTLHSANFIISIETNGTLKLSNKIDWVVCSPKENSKIVLNNVDELKIVYLNQDVEFLYNKIKAKYYYLQPCSMLNTQDIIKYILANPHWQLSLQIHKILNIK